MDNVKIVHDINIKLCKCEPHDASCDDYYENFIAFLTNSYFYAMKEDVNLTVEKFIKKLDIIKYFSIFTNYNVYTCDQPSLFLSYITENKYIQSDFYNTMMTNDITKFHNKDDIFILYTIHENNIRFIRLENKKYLTFNIAKRKNRERKEKLKILNQ